MSINSKLVTIAKNLRQNMTKAEKTLWNEIRNRKLRIKFRRQMPLVLGNYNFIPDFYSNELKLIIEVDGKIHEQEENIEYDKIRESLIKESGYNILRFTNDEVLYNIDYVIKEIRNYINNNS